MDIPVVAVFDDVSLECSLIKFKRAWILVLGTTPEGHVVSGGSCSSAGEAVGKRPRYVSNLAAAEVGNYLVAKDSAGPTVSSFVGGSLFRRRGASPVSARLQMIPHLIRTRAHALHGLPQLLLNPNCCAQ